MDVRKCSICDGAFNAGADAGRRVKTIRFHLPVLANDDEEDYLDLVTRVPGVVAALVSEKDAALDVVVAGDSAALLVSQQVREALLVAASAVAP
jgi:hypothetical protein